MPEFSIDYTCVYEARNLSEAVAKAEQYAKTLVACDPDMKKVDFPRQETKIDPPPHPMIAFKPKIKPRYICDMECGKRYWIEEEGAVYQVVCLGRPTTEEIMAYFSVAGEGYYQKVQNPKTRKPFIIFEKEEWLGRSMRVAEVEEFSPVLSLEN